MSKEALAVSEEAIFESVFSAGIWLEAFFKDLTVFQNCLHPCLETFLKCSLFDFLRIVTTSFLSEVYFFHKDGFPDFLALLYTLFLFLSFALIFLFIQGILCLVEMVTFGMHSSIISMNFVSQMSHAESMLDSLYKGVQSVVSISLLAFSKSAWAYFQMARFLAFMGGGFLDHFRVRVNPL